MAPLRDTEEKLRTVRRRSVDGRAGRTYETLRPLEAGLVHLVRDEARGLPHEVLRGADGVAVARCEAGREAGGEAEDGEEQKDGYGGAVGGQAFEEHRFWDEAWGRARKNARRTGEEGKERGPSWK